MSMGKEELLRAVRSRENQYTQQGIEDLVFLNTVAEFIIYGIGEEDARRLVNLLDNGYDTDFMIIVDYTLNSENDICE